jgi:TonB-linked SusC/RagA family outer membrane protein
MKRILLISFVLMASLIGEVMAQRTVTGQVTSGTDGEGLPGVSVRAQGTSTGVTTDFNGNYRMEVPEGVNTLVFSFVGFETQEVPIGNRSTIDVVLQEDVQQLQEVVVTALGIQREERALGYAVQEVRGAELTQARETNVVNALSGRVAGVQVSGNQGGMGGSSRILIRGASSITGNNQPLFVVDGVPMDNSNFGTTNQARGAGGYDYGSTIQDINPDDIESINVLKGPSAAALYGTRAANGVIVITTKKGAKQKGIGVDVNTGVTMNNIMFLPNYQNLYGGGYGPFTQNEAGENLAYFAMDESWGPRMDGRPVRQWYSYFEGDEHFGQTTPWVANPDNVRNFFETGVTYNAGVAVSGGGENATFRLGYTNLNQTYVLPNSELNRNNLNFSGSVNLTDKLSTSVNANYVAQEATGRPGTGYSGDNVMQQFNQWSQRQMSMDKLREYRGVGGIQRTWNIIGPNNLTPMYSDNPYWTRYENWQNDSRERIFGNVTVSYAFTDNLKLTTRFMTDFYTDLREERVAVGSQDIPNYTKQVRTVGETNTDLMLSYDASLGGDFSLNAFVGGNMMYQNYELSGGTTQAGLNIPGFYNLRNSAGPMLPYDNFQERAINSVFGSASFGFRGMLYLDATLRNDWSSTLPAGNNSYLYPSLTGSFVFTELPFLQGSDVFSFGKLRLGWAQVGNDTDPFRILTAYEPFQNFGENPSYSLPVTLNNEDLQPERTTSWETGVDLRFFNGRAGLDVTYYDNTTRNQIFPLAVSRATGYGFRVINAGEMRNYGVEVVLRATPIQMPDNGFRWEFTLNFARNRNQVVELTEGIDNYRLTNAPFKVSLNAREGQPYGTIEGTNFDYVNGQKRLTSTGLYARTTEQVPLGTIMPDFNAGLINSFSYKGINASFLIDMQQGGSLFSTSNMFGLYSGMLEETAVEGPNGNIREVGVVPVGVTADGEAWTTPIRAESYFQGMYSGPDALFVYDASYVKLREVRIGYTLPNRIAGAFRNVTLSLVGRNLAILHKNIPHLDPEASLSTGNIQGIEGAQLPSVRSIGVNLNFSL